MEKLGRKHLMNLIIVDMKLIRSLGFAVFALALTNDSTPLTKVNYPFPFFLVFFSFTFPFYLILLKYPENRHVAVMVGHEGAGLSKEAVSVRENLFCVVFFSF
jgi:tRNA G18 (ribose-2'-O)-methylase SpoU